MSENNWWFTPPNVGAIHELPEPEVPQETRSPLPWQAYALVGRKERPDTWKLPHHTRAINKAIKGKIGIERTVDWMLIDAAAAALSPSARLANKVEASPEEILQAAKHLADHYRKADKPLPDILAVLT